MLRSLSEYSLIVSDSFILCISNSLMRFNTCIALIFSSPSYSSLRKSQIALADFRAIILVKIDDDTAANRQAFAFVFLCLFSL
ncbi:hypothetical protein Scep_018784 [Stephania cephalantha]|uniref:Uncharacterized protein n=1 Tax=Stephania cephalantha TaxID=152367 RepID=A0AAP0NMK8_9MAGN